jgi:hypothetical protein
MHGINYFIDGKVGCGRLQLEQCLSRKHKVTRYIFYHSVTYEEAKFNLIPI